MEKQVLKLLRESAGSFISGQKMGRRLRVSRTTVWKAVESLRAKGFQINSSAKRGYKLESEPERPVGEAIEVGLGTQIVGKSVFSFDSVSSTIDVANSYALEDCPEGTVVIAESQVKGRGRLGRKWSSSGGRGIWTSIILRPPVSPREAPKLTLLTAVSVAKALIEQHDIKAQIKWPNDVVVGGRKICGALTEMVGEQDRIRYLIASFGLNVNHTSSDFPPDVVPIATSMRMEAGRVFDRSEVFRGLLREYDRQYYQFKQGGGAEILNQWRMLSCTLGKHVMVQMRERTVEGIAREIDEDGSLLVEVSKGHLETISHGDVSIIRGAEQPGEGRNA